MKRVVLLMLSGCSVIFMERVPDSHITGQTAHCTGSKGFVAWDTVLSVAHAVSAFGTFSVAGSVDESTKGSFQLLGGLSAAFSIVHLISAATGNGWANDCRDARLAESETDQPRTVIAAPSPSPSNVRKLVRGDKPLHCAVTSLDVGICFLDESACAAELEKSGAPSCELRTAGSCMNATKILDGTKLTVCAVSIKDCEARRATYAADPDYKVTPCGVYRAK